MKELRCELCESNKLLKQDDRYICQNCGTEYTIEAARKLFVEIEAEAENADEPGKTAAPLDATPETANDETPSNPFSTEPYVAHEENQGQTSVSSDTAAQAGKDEPPTETPRKKFQLKKGHVIAIAIAAAVIVAAIIVALFATHVLCIHNWAAATCTQPETCTICGERKLGSDVLGHDWEEATCTESSKCKRCGFPQGKPLGHTIEKGTVTKEATCTEEGEQTGTCSRCGEKVTESIPMTPHTEGEWAIIEEATIDDAGKTKEGKRALLCSVCGAQMKTESYSLSAEEIEANYKAGCASFSYEEVARDPEGYRGSKARFRGKVIQVMESSGTYALRVNVTEGRYSWSDTVYVNYTAPAGANRILEDDIITMYGTMAGIKTYTTVMGASMAIPQMNVKYIEY